MEGYPFTWERGRNTENWVEERLDWVFTSERWQTMFPETVVYNINAPSSDHSMLLVEMEKMLFSKQSQLFHFENAWVNEPECEAITKWCWSGQSRESVISLMGKCKDSLADWGKGITNRFQKIINECKERLESF